MTYDLQAVPDSIMIWSTVPGSKLKMSKTPE